MCVLRRGTDFLVLFEPPISEQWDAIFHTLRRVAEGCQSNYGKGRYTRNITAPVIRH